jgi:pyruvate formate-lyase activating enzyme-like uncharacterized protein
MEVRTARCGCSICVLANALGFASDGDCAKNCDYCTDGVFDKEKWDRDTEEKA